MYDAQPLKFLDVELEQLCSGLNVVIMPGETDPAVATLPQEPLNKCLFPRSMQYSSLTLVTNPYAVDICGVKFLGSSGQTLDDIERYLTVEDRMQAAIHTLKWGHVAPTAPDTICKFVLFLICKGCYPYIETDPFIMEERPHVYFIGNQDAYQSELYKGDHFFLIILDEYGTTRVILLPNFSVTGQIVLLNIATLETKVVNFKDQD
jgi:DNA polymerase delta subunit 2